MGLAHKQTAALILAASFASTIGGLPFNSLPILLGSLADSFGFEVQTIGNFRLYLFCWLFVGHPIFGRAHKPVLFTKINRNMLRIFSHAAAIVFSIDCWLANATVGFDWLFCSANDLSWFKNYWPDGK